VSGALFGSLCGLLTATGLLLVVGRWRATAPPNLAMRVGVHRGTRSITHRQAGPLSTYLALLIPRWTDAPGAASRLLAGAGRSGGIPQLRMDQVTWGGSGLVIGALIAWWSIIRGATPVALVVLPALGAVIALLLLDRRISAQAKRRRARIEQQLPDIAELLAFAVAAGESIAPALHRVCSMVTGDLADELRVVVAEVATGIPLEVSLRSASDRMGAPSVERFVDGLIISLERGTPLVAVVRAQASDARTVQQQSLMELAGRKDVIMLIPVVFLILPTVVAIALFPGLRGLQALTS
jgi:tight adherence protein C